MTMGIGRKCRRWLAGELEDEDEGDLNLNMPDEPKDEPRKLRKRAKGKQREDEPEKKKEPKKKRSYRRAFGRWWVISDLPRRAPSESHRSASCLLMIDSKACTAWAAKT